MREDNEHYRHYGALLRRIGILIAVLAAVPVILWGITGFVRTYVGQPKVPTFRQLAATGTIALPPNATASVDPTSQPMPTSDQSRLADASPASEANVDTPGTGNAFAAPKASPWPDDHVAAGGSKMADMSATPPASTRATEMPAGNDAAANTGALAAPAGLAMNASADVWPAAEPLSGPIPLPPHRPRLVAMAQADSARVPIPRPRPDIAAPVAADGTAGPFDWLQNMFHKNAE
jgi:hypothetical protein